MSDRGRTRVGILLDSTWCNIYLFHVIEELAYSDDVDLVYLINSRPPRSRSQQIWLILDKIRVRSLRRVIDLVAFRSWARLEKKITARFIPSVREQGERRDVSSLPHLSEIRLEPKVSPSGFVSRYSASDVTAVESLELDLIVRGNAGAILRGDILNASKEGILAFHHGDNRWNRGGPPGFWEVYHRKPSTGFVIQILSTDHDGGQVIFRGNLPTARTFSDNVSRLYRDSYPYLAKLVLDYSKVGQLPPAETRVPYGGQLLRAPSVSQLAAFVVRSAYRAVPLLLSRFVLRRRVRWGVGFVNRPWPDASLRRGTEVVNPRGRFLADPFVVEMDQRAICFVEDYAFKSKTGRISAVELLGDSEYKFLGPVIEENFHMSFPYVFTHQGDLYMVPETRAAGSIRLYRCVDFPMSWEFKRELISNTYAVDPMIFEFSNYWWLLANTSLRKDGVAHSRLEAFYTDDPIRGEWKPHASNPLLVDSTVARNAGILHAQTGEVVRCRQSQGFANYGESLSLALINDLSPTSFSEKPIGEVVPDFFPNLVACHHLHGSRRYTVFDFARREAPL